MKIGILGGSFNPVTIGHIENAKYALSNFDIEQVVIMPCHNHAFKKSLEDSYHRTIMCELAFGNILDVWVSRFEIENNPSGKMYDTIIKLKEYMPDHEYSLIVGSDVLDELHSWYRIDDLKTLLPLHVVPRKGTSSTEVRDIFKSRYSSYYKKCLLEENLLHPDVFKYILDNYLYESTTIHNVSGGNPIEMAIKEFSWNDNGFGCFGPSRKGYNLTMSPSGDTSYTMELEENDIQPLINKLQIIQKIIHRRNKKFGYYERI